MNDKSTQRKGSRSVQVGLGFAAIISFAFLLLPYETARPIADLASPDGSLDLYTTAIHRTIQGIMGICGVAALVLVLAIPRYYPHVLANIRQIDRRVILAWVQRDLSEIRTSITAFSQDKAYGVVLLLLTLIAAVIRALYLSQPMQHDEAYTYTAFASRPLWNVISDYHLPNNHVLHTILVHISTQLLGNAPWAVRMPAFLAGVLLVPAAYLAGRQIYNQQIGLAGAAVVTVSPLLIEYSANGRGYTLLCLFTLLTVSLAVYVKGHKNIIAWVLLVLLTSLGFYTLPVMLYPFAMICTWLLLCVLFKDIEEQNPRLFLFFLLIFSVLALILSATLYAPVFFVSGIDALVSNQYVRYLEYSSLWESLAGRVAGVYRDWVAGLPGYAVVIALVGIVLGLVFHQRVSSHRVHLLPAALLGIGIVLSIQRVAPLPRIWLFLQPLAILWVLAGIVGGIQFFIPARWQRTVLATIVLGLFLLPAAYRTVTQIGTVRTGSIGVEEEIALYLQSSLRPEDLVVVLPPLATPIEYYFMRYNLPLNAFEEQREDIHRILVIISSKYQQTLEEALKTKGPRDTSQFSTIQPIHRYKHVTIYELSP